MNDILARILDVTSPKFNKQVVDGSAKDVLKLIPAFLDEIYSSNIKSLSKNVDLTYNGYRVMTPKEEFNKMLVNENKTMYDLAVSDLYMVEYLFTYRGETIRRPLYLPFAREGNLIHISNTAYNVVPVLSDTVISPSYTEVFVRILKDKITFKNDTRNFMINGEKLPGQIIHSNIVKVNTTQLTDNIGKPIIPTSLYFLGEYGIRETFKRYCKTSDYIITDGDVESLRDTYNIYESTKIKPRNLKDVVYIGHDVKICISKKVTLTAYIENLIFGMLWALDTLPTEGKEFMATYNANDVKNEKFLWRMILGRITYRDSYSVSRMYEDIEEHFYMLQDYLDDIGKVKLRENNIIANNFFDLLAVIMANYNVWLINSKEYNSDIGNRYIDILYYICYDLFVGFNRVVLTINKRSTKTKDISYKEINKIFADNLSTRKIFSIVKSNQMNLCIMLSDCTNDLMYPKGTALLEDQSRGNGVKRGTNSQFPESTKTIKGHDLALGSLLFLTKAAPSPRFRVNPYVNYSLETGRIDLPNDIKNAVGKLDVMLRGREDNALIDILDESDALGDADHESECGLIDDCVETEGLEE